MTLLAVFQVLLYRYSGQKDIGGGDADREPDAGGDGRADWIFCEHIGDEDGDGRGMELSGVAGAGERRRRWKRMGTRMCRLRRWWRSWSRSETWGGRRCFR